MNKRKPTPGELHLAQTTPFSLDTVYKVVDRLKSEEDAKKVLDAASRIRLNPFHFIDIAENLEKNHCPICESPLDYTNSTNKVFKCGSRIWNAPSKRKDITPYCIALAKIDKLGQALMDCVIWMESHQMILSGCGGTHPERPCFAQMDHVIAKAKEAMDA